LNRKLQIKCKII